MDKLVETMFLMNEIKLSSSFFLLFPLPPPSLSKSYFT